MDIEGIRLFCLSLPFTTEDVKWGNDLAFCIGKKMFTVVGLEMTENCSISFKCTPEKFAELVELAGIIPAQYVARYHWVTVQKLDALNATELQNLIKQSYKLVWEKLPKSLQKQLNS